MHGLTAVGTSQSGSLDLPWKSQCDLKYQLHQPQPLFGIAVQKTVIADSPIKRMRLTLHEFTRRLLWHVLPKRFVRIRHYGLHANNAKAERGKPG